MPKPKSEQTNIVSIQILRGIAAWLVVFHHYNQAFFNWDMDNSIIGIGLGDFFKYYGKLGVDIFFVISGFIIYISGIRSQKPLIFIKRRLFRIIPPYWLYTLVYLVLSIAIPSTILSDWSILSLSQSLFFINNENPSPALGYLPFLPIGWTLNFEVYFYIICLITMSFLGKSWPFFTALFLLFSDYLWPFETLSFFFKSYYIKEFGAGIILSYLYINHCPPKDEKIALLLLLSSIFLFVIGGAQVNKLPAILLLVSSLLMLEDGKFDNILGYSFKTLGNWSYSTYLIHAAVTIPLCSFFFPKDSYYNNDLALLSTYIIMTAILSYLSFKYIECKVVSSQ